MKTTNIISESIGIPELTEMLKNYIDNNNKMLLLNIKDAIDNIVELKQIPTKYVYRGLAVNNDDSLDLIKLNELDNKFVATSPDKFVAIEYAKNGNPKRSILIKYKLLDDSIIFDTRIIKDILTKITDRYADEIVIDVSKSITETIEQI